VLAAEVLEPGGEAGDLVAKRGIHGAESAELGARGVGDGVRRQLGDVAGRDEDLAVHGCPPSPPSSPTPPPRPDGCPPGPFPRGPVRLGFAPPMIEGGPFLALPLLDRIGDVAAPLCGTEAGR